MSYLLPVAINSKVIVSIPPFTGLATIIGLIPENKKIGAKIINMTKIAKQKPMKNFSQKPL
jgi:hypothetical protein